jgi:protein SCO1
VNPRVRYGATVAGILAVALAAVVVIAEQRDPVAGGSGQRFEGALMPPGVRAPDFTLRDERGDIVRMRDLRGTPVVVTFLYTTCRDSCPVDAQQVRGALDLLGRDVPALAVAVDPPRDTAARARRFLVQQQLLGRMRFVLGSRAELRPVWDGFFIQPQTEETDHQSRAVLIDARGYQRVGYPGSELTPERLAHDLRVLLDEA